MNEAQAIHAQLRAARKSQGLTLEQLADRAGITSGIAQISLWESGKRQPQLPTLQVWASALGLTIALLPKGSNMQTRHDVYERLAEALASCDWNEAGLVASGPYEAQTLATVYYSIKPKPEALGTSSGMKTQYLLPVTPDEARILFLDGASHYLVENWLDGTFCGAPLAPHEVSALRAKGEKNGTE